MSLSGIGSTPHFYQPLQKSSTQITPKFGDPIAVRDDQWDFSPLVEVMETLNGVEEITKNRPSETKLDSTPSQTSAITPKFGIPRDSEAQRIMGLGQEPHDFGSELNLEETVETNKKPKDFMDIFLGWILQK